MLPEAPLTDPDRLVIELLRALRGSRSQQALSMRLGYRSNVVARWESGTRRMAAHDGFRLLRVVGAGPHAGLPALDPTLTGVLDGMDPDGPAHATAALVHLCDGVALADLAARGPLTRAQLGRALRGEAVLRWSDLLALAQLTVGGVLDWLAVHVDLAELPSVADVWEARQRTTALLVDHPFVAALPVLFRSRAYLDLPEHDPAWVAARLGVTEAEVLEVWPALETAGLVALEGRHAVATGVLPARPPAAVQAAQEDHWAALAHRAGRGHGCYTGYMMLTCEDAQVGELGASVAEVLADAAQAAPSDTPGLERVALCLVQAVAIDDGTIPRTRGVLGPPSEAMTQAVPAFPATSYDMRRVAAELMRAARGERSQQELAATLGVVPSVVSRWESGARVPSAADALQVFAATGLDLNAAIRPIDARFDEALDAAPPPDPALPHLLVRELCKDHDVADLATATGMSRQALGRLLRDEARVKLPDLLALFEASLGRLLRLVEALVPPSAVPALEVGFANRRNRRLLYREWPVVTYLDTSIRTEAYRTLPAHDTAWFQHRCQLPVATIDALFARMDALELVTWTGTHWAPGWYASLNFEVGSNGEEKLAVCAFHAGTAFHRQQERRTVTVAGFLGGGVPELRAHSVRVWNQLNQARRALEAYPAPERVVMLIVQLVPLDGEAFDFGQFPTRRPPN
jgi:transcriptional regulator with XRE-family HTH domain